MRLASRLLGILALTAASASAQCDLTTLFAANNGGAVGGAVYFDLNVTTAIQVSGLDVNTSVNGTAIGLTMYTIPGGTAGAMGSSAGWTQVGIDDGTSIGAGQNNPSSITFTSPAIINPGLYGVALIGTGNGGSMDHDYTNGAGGMAQVFSNSFYTITAGNADNTGFGGGGFFPRVWNGTIKCQGANGVFADFVGDVTSGPEPLTVNFTDLTFTSDPGGIVEWDWDFDDDGIIDSTDQNPTWTYANCGVYTVRLSATAARLGTDTVRKVGYISVGDIPVADFMVDVTAGNAPLTVNFTDISTGSPTSWLWELEAPGVGFRTDQNPTYIYDPTMGICFTVTLTVTNACGSDTITKTDVICMVVNDECTDAVTVVDGVNGPFINVGATNSPTPWSCAGSGGSDVWFEYTATCDGNVTFDLCTGATNYDSAIEVFDGNGGCGGALIVCNDDFCGLQSGATVPAVTGDVFYVRVGGFNGAQGMFELNVTCTGAANNDECSGAVALAEGVNGPYNSTSATTSAPAWNCALGGNDLWFSFTSTCAGTVTFDTCSAATNFDTAINVFDGSGGCVGLVEIECNDDFCGLQSAVTAAANPGDVFYVRVGGFNGSQGDFEVNVTCGTAGNDFIPGSIQTSSPPCGKLTQVTTGDATIGSTVHYSMEPVSGLGFMWMGLSKVRIPVCGGCELGTELGIAPLTSIVIPNDPLFIGVTYYTQGADVGGVEGCTGGNPFGISLSLSETKATTIGM